MEELMARSVNRIILIGNVGRDPDIQQTKNGTKVAHFSVATNRRIPSGTDGEERTDWHRLTLWNKQAQFAEDYIRTGDRVYIEGKLRTRTWQDAGGTEHRTVEIVADRMDMLGGSSRQEAPSETQEGQGPHPIDASALPL